MKSRPLVITQRDTLAKVRKPMPPPSKVMTATDVRRYVRRNAKQAWQKEA